MRQFFEALFLAAVALYPVLVVAQPDQSQRYALILRAPAVTQLILKEGASRAALATPAAEAHRKMLLKDQASLRATLKQRKVAVTGSVQTLLNAVFVVASSSRVAELKALPEVASVVRLPSIRAKLNSALELVGASTAWTALGGAGNAGAGAKIAILDSGIDETHPGFQDPSLAMPAGFPKTSNGNDAMHATNKIIAVRSFVASLAIGDGTPQFTRPDDLSARDRVGHGTAVAMIAAGVAHQSPLGMISGVAPKAWLGSYKIFGSPGVNDASTADVALEALEAAFNDGMDVALLSAGNLSAIWAPADQGAACGLPAGTFCDPWAAAVSSAARGRMVVVVPAGNDGALGLGTINTPGDAPDAITVGASTNIHTLSSTVTTPSGDRLAAQFGDGPKLPAVISAPLATVSSIDSTELGCLGFDSGSLGGKMILVATGQCSHATKVLHAQAAGAAAVLLFQSSLAQPDPLQPAPFQPPSDSTLSAPSGLTNTAIPVAIITAKSADFLKGYLTGHPDAVVTLDPTITPAASTNGETVASFSSRGPAIGGSTIKPDLVAPAASIYTAAQNYDPNGSLYTAGRYIGADGTSFAAAIVAGAAALVKQAHPGYTASQIKSALTNSATPGISGRDGNPARSIEAGAGKLNLRGAIATTLTAEPTSISFGAVNSGLGAPRTLTISNTGSIPAGIQLSVRQRDNDSVARVTATPDEFTLAPGQSRSVAIALTGGIPPAGLYEGVVVLSGGAVPVQVPYLYLVGDGKPSQLIPLSGADFVTEARTAVNLSFRVLDRYGVAIPNVPVRFAPAASVYLATPATDSLGIAEAYMYTSAALGDQNFGADLLTNAARVLFTGRTRPRPQIGATGVVDAASGQDSKGYAPGSYISIFGSGLSESLIVSTTPSLPVSLAGVSVSFDAPAANIHLPGRLHFASSGQINVQIPWELAGTTSALVKVTLSNSDSQTIRGDDPGLGTFQSQLVTVPIAAYSPSFFEYTDAPSGRRMAAALTETNTVLSSTNPAQRGQIVQFFVNGLGPVTAGSQPPSGEAAAVVEPFARTQTTPLVTMGDRKATVVFSGLAPGLIGLYQVNATVPSDVNSGFLAVVISIGGVASRATTIAIQ